MNSITMQKAKELQYNILKEVHKVCVDHNITYYLAYGTLLGAIRHNGIIPWDDDIDIMMPREDFIKLQKVFSSDRYKVIWCYDCKEHTRSYGRVYDIKTFKKLGRHKALGLNIDVNLLYGAPDENKKLEHQKNIERLVKKRFILNRIMRRLAQLYLWPKSKLEYDWLNKTVINIEKEYNKYPYNDNNDVYISPFYNIYKREWFREKVLHTFEDGEFFIPNGYDEILRCCYGDYMQLPPEEERKRNHGRSSYSIVDSDV